MRMSLANSDGWKLNGPSAIHRRSFDARCYAELEEAAIETVALAAARA